MRILITGAGGNLGRKLSARLETRDWCDKILGIERAPFTASGKVTPIVADLRDATDTRWHEAVAKADAVVHFAAENPYPNATWAESARSFDMTANLLDHAGNHPCRFIFASSNHAMGGYKDAPLPENGKLNGATPPLPGTRYFDGTGTQSSPAYGASKLLGERAIAARAAGTAGRLTGVAVRIGWCQPGENLAQTLTGGDMLEPGAGAEAIAAANAKSLRWFRNMWLSNGDFLNLFERALIAPAAGWPGPFIVVNGMSNNTGMAWDLDPGEQLIGYRPVDNVWQDLGLTP